MEVSRIGPSTPNVPSRRVQQAPAVIEPAPKDVPVDQASLTEENRLDLSQKAQVQPPTPPDQTSKKKKADDKKPSQKAQEMAVEGQDFAGRTCVGTIHGPLLMEDPDALQFEASNQQDVSTLFSTAVRLGGMSKETLHAPADEVPVATGPNFAYYGVKEDTAHLVEWMEEGLVGTVSETEVKLANGQVVKISRGESQTSIYIPAACLDNLAGWGRTLLGIG